MRELQAQQDIFLTFKTVLTVSKRYFSRRILMKCTNFIIPSHTERLLHSQCISDR